MIKPLPEHVYNKHPSLRQSDFKNFLISPREYQRRKDEDIPKEHFSLGTIAHALVLEPGAIKDKGRFVQYDQLNPTTGKPYQMKSQKCQDFVAGTPAGVTIYTKEILQDAMTIAEYVLRYVNLPPPSYRELSAFTTLHGVNIKARADWISWDRDGCFIWDLKLTRDLDRWAREARYVLKYHIAAVWYANCFFEGLGTGPGRWQPDGMKFLVVSNDPENLDHMVYEPSLDAIAEAAELIDTYLPEFRECRENNEWPGRWARAREF